MKFSNRTLQVLKNFVSINPSLVFKDGNVLSTMSPTKTIIAKATLQENIDSTFAVYDLGKFISTLGLFTDPDLTINEKFMNVDSGKSSIKYFFAEPSLIVQPPQKDIPLPSSDVSFSLSNDQLQAALKALDVLSLPEIAFKGEAGKVYITALDAKGDINDAYQLEVGESESNFLAVFKKENLKLLIDTYDVILCKAGLAKFTSKDVEYFVAFEAKVSRFE